MFVRGLRRLRPMVVLARSWLYGDLLVVEVRGPSMRPALEQGDLVFCARTRPIRRGSIVLREIERGGRPFRLIKRVRALAGDVVGGDVIPPGHCWIEGDDWSTSRLDSRQTGPVPTVEIKGVAIARLATWRLHEL